MIKWQLGMYRRRSADEKGSEESNSVANQKKLIDIFIKNNKDLKLKKDYVDDGYTGTDFERPGFQEMISDIESGKINAVIVKDLSRLGRNYIGVDKFLDEIVPKYNIRFISINDNVDTYINPNIMNSLDIPIKNLMNESYSRDSSEKLKSSLRASKKAGNFIGKVAPYGYIKDKEDGHKFVVDPDASKVVKKIFDMILSGKSKQEVANYLNNNHILSPMAYLNERLNYSAKITTKEWTNKTIDKIVKNKTYIGYLVQGRKRRVSHKIHKLVAVPENEWIIVENHHKPIVSKEVFEQVNDILYNRNIRICNNGELKKYTGFIKCADCGANLYRMSKKDNNVKIYYYYCSNYINNKTCSKHYITEIDLDNIVLSLLNRQIDLVCDIDKKISDTLYSSRAEYDKEVKKIKIIEIDKEISKIQELLNGLLDDYKSDYISKDELEEYNRDYLYQLNQLRIEKEEIDNNFFQTSNLDWINRFKKIKKLDALNRTIVSEFIKNIFIDENSNVEIEFRYKDQFDDAIRYLKSNNI